MLADIAFGDVMPSDKYHHSGHRPSFPPPGQKQLLIICPVWPAVLQTGFLQIIDIFEVH